MFAVDNRVVRLLADIDVKHRLMLLVLVLSEVYSVIALVNFVSNADQRRFWKSHPWAGLRKRLFPRTRAGLDAIRHTRDIVERGFKEVRQARFCVTKGSSS
jgi:hypothetical protein